MNWIIKVTGPVAYERLPMTTRVPLLQRSVKLAHGLAAPHRYGQLPVAEYVPSAPSGHRTVIVKVSDDAPIGANASNEVGEPAFRRSGEVDTVDPAGAADLLITCASVGL